MDALVVQCNRTMRHTKTIILAGVTLALLSVPSTLAQESKPGVIGIKLQSVPNAVSIEWEEPVRATADHYTVYYSKRSILDSNGKFDDKEQTLGPETSLVLLDLKNRGFSDGESIFVTVTYTDMSGKENATFAEEQSTKVKVPGTVSAEPPHESATPSPGTIPSAVTLENAIAENFTTVRMDFSAPVRIPPGSAVQYFSLTEETTGTPVAVLSAESQGSTVFLTTLPMIPRTRYIVSVSEGVTGIDGTALNEVKREVTFVARGEDTLPPQGGPAPSEIIVPELLDLPVINEDRTPPEPPRNLALTKTLERNGLYRVEASWNESLNTEGDLQSYNVYESADRGKKFVGPTALRATVTSTTIANVPPGTLTVKITAMDQSGNESEGTEETILLPETGPALTLLLSVAGASLWTVRRKLFHC